MRPKRTVAAGERYGRLITLEPAGHSRARVACRCDCGRENPVLVYALVNGNTRSCGCLRGTRKTNVHTHRKPQRREGLHSRGREVLLGCAQGLTNNEIGGRLHLSEETVRTHVKHMLDTLGARTRAHAVALAYQHGLLDEHTPIPRYDREAAA